MIALAIEASPYIGVSLFSIMCGFVFGLAYRCKRKAEEK